jgi:hypothetical protein
MALPDLADIAEAVKRQQALLLMLASDLANAGVIDPKNRQTWGQELNDRVTTLDAAAAIANSKEVCAHRYQSGERCGYTEEGHNYWGTNKQAWSHPYARAYLITEKVSDASA